MKQLEYIQKTEEVIVTKDSMNTFAALYVENILRKFFGEGIFDGLKWCEALSWLIKSYGHGAGCGMETNNVCDAAFFDYEYYNESSDNKLVLCIKMWKVVATEVKRKY